jgi:hypothetical protein
LPTLLSVIKEGKKQHFSVCLKKAGKKTSTEIYFPTFKKSRQENNF